MGVVLFFFECDLIIFSSSVEMNLAKNRKNAITKIRYLSLVTLE